jgi:hypothetical protein
MLQGLQLQASTNICDIFTISVAITSVGGRRFPISYSGSVKRLGFGTCTEGKHLPCGSMTARPLGF